MAELLLEIGCEEIPASWLPGLGEQLRARFEELAAKEPLTTSGVRSLWTPRRLVLVAEVPVRQDDREETIFGPPQSAARDASGVWTSAAKGFAKKVGRAPEELLSLPKAAGAEVLYLAHTRRIEGRPAKQILPILVGQLLRALAFPKRMSWDAWLDDGKGAFPFGRPIRWIAAMLDGDVVPFTIYVLENGAKGAPIVQSGNVTFAHRFLPRGAAGRPIQVASFAELLAKLREGFVLLDPEERAARIRASLADLGRTADDHGLVAEWRDLVECPAVMVGGIPAEFRSLPREVLETVLVHHQKYLPIASGGAVTRFAAVTNGDGSNAAEITRGMERVVVARLRDGRFFFEEDLKRPLPERVEDLAGVTFHQKLGSYREKADRMTRLVTIMGAEMGLLTKPEHEAARQAALLAKADLTTLMVREFTELQGVMGGIYLRAQGHGWEGVASAVHWHYHPISIEEGSPPASALAGSDATVFGAVSLADKLDTLAGYFGLGLMPTGSSDPYGLRRAAQGIVRVLLDFWNAAEAEERPNLRRLVAAAVAGYGGALSRPAAEVVPELAAFLFDRLRYVLVARGYPADEVEAVLGAREPDALENPHEAWVRLKALHRVRQEAREDFEHLAVAFKRARNILGDRREARPDATLFQEDAERLLDQAVSGLSGRDGGYEARLRALASLRAPVDRFFDDVLVMAEDPKLRENRLGLLARTLSLFYRIADISKLGGQA
ncbi:MAG TPA: glycine--tRNA ligase subunit beta [Vicinamibacteria bacterium]|nr:glycine--tRNA ligase subunit beta [Vicinamibacteria bacterium]